MKLGFLNRRCYFLPFSAQILLLGYFSQVSDFFHASYLPRWQVIFCERILRIPEMLLLFFLLLSKQHKPKLSQYFTFSTVKHFLWILGNLDLPRHPNVLLKPKSFLIGDLISPWFSYSLVFTCCLWNMLWIFLLSLLCRSGKLRKCTRYIQAKGTSFGGKFSGSCSTWFPNPRSFR